MSWSPDRRIIGTEITITNHRPSGLVSPNTTDRRSKRKATATTTFHRGDNRHRPLPKNQSAALSRVEPFRSSVTA
jgi:hypothetical protein